MAQLKLILMRAIGDILHIIYIGNKYTSKDNFVTRTHQMKFTEIKTRQISCSITRRVSNKALHATSLCVLAVMYNFVWAADFDEPATRTINGTPDYIMLAELSGGGTTCARAANSMEFTVNFLTGLAIGGNIHSCSKAGWHSAAECSVDVCSHGFSNTYAQARQYYIKHNCTNAGPGSSLSTKATTCEKIANEAAIYNSTH